MVGSSKARVGGRTVRSSVVTIHQKHKSEFGSEWDDKYSSTLPTTETALDSTLGASASASPATSPADKSIVAFEPQSICNKVSSVSEKAEMDAIEECDNDRDGDGDGGSDGDIAQPADTPEVEAAPESRPPPCAPPKKSVSFHVVEIREYTRTLGDHPDTMAGPPITLTWEYCTPTDRPLGLDEYESERGERRTKTQLLVHPNVRRGWLRDGGKQSSMPVTDQEMKNVEREVHRSALRRRNSAAFYPLVGPVEEAVQSITRKIKRGSWRSNDSRWWEQNQQHGKL